MNTVGHTPTLVAAHPRNANRLVHGVYATMTRDVPEKARAIADELMGLPHVTESDYPAALEIAKLTLLIDRVDAALANGKIETRGSLRALVDQRRKLSAQLERWYAAFGMTPSARADWAAKLGAGSLGSEIRRRLEDVQAVGE